jgi:hypothetical protein
LVVTASGDGHSQVAPTDPTTTTTDVDAAGADGDGGCCETAVVPDAPETVGQLSDSQLVEDPVRGRTWKPKSVRLPGASDALSRVGDTGGEAPIAEDLGDGECTVDDVPQPNRGIAEPPGQDGCPPGMAPINGMDVCIDRWEAFLVEISDDGSTLPWSPYFCPGRNRVRAVSAPGAVPQGYINEVQAADACHEAGKRLCTSDEWMRACRGPNNFTYPYGDVRESGQCNDHRSRHPAVELYETSERWIWHELDNSCLNQLDNSLARTGENAMCVTGDHVYDLMGNLHEWVDDPEGTFRGGFYSPPTLTTLPTRTTALASAAALIDSLDKHHATVR